MSDDTLETQRCVFTNSVTTQQHPADNTNPAWRSFRSSEYWRNLKTWNLSSKSSNISAHECFGTEACFYHFFISFIIAGYKLAIAW